MPIDKNPLRRESLVEQLADRLLTIIIDDHLDEGDSLPSTADLAARFGVSIIVVREAVAILVGRGIVRRQQGREPLIRRPGSEVLDSLFRVRASQEGMSTGEIQQCRSVLELQAAALAASASNEDGRRAVLEPLMEQMRNATGMAELTLADQAFHEGVVELSGNRAVGLVIGALRTAVLSGVDENWHRWFQSHDGSPAPAVARHQSIADAIIKGDRTLAVQAMADHFLEWEEFVDFGPVGAFASPSHDLAGVVKLDQKSGLPLTDR